jgi:N-formylglutamate amidohydrolase
MSSGSGFSTAKEGLIFHFMQACWYRLLVDINRDELRRRIPPVENRIGTPPGSRLAATPRRASVCRFEPKRPARVLRATENREGDGSVGGIDEHSRT